MEYNFYLFLNDAVQWLCLAFIWAYAWEKGKHDET